MKFNRSVFLSIAVGAVLSACSAAPERIEVLETARTAVPQVESSARAGVAATYVTQARKALDEANRLADSGGELSDIEYEAQNAVINARIAQEKILTAQAREEISEGKEHRQSVLLDARERDVTASKLAASDARDDAAASELRADSLEKELADLQLQKTERGLVLTLGDVLFDSGASTLKSGSYSTIDRLSSALRDKAGRSVVIEGHTDDVGSDEMNQALSERRARSVETALLQRGVPSGQVRSQGMGERRPIASNENASGRQQNRRVELIFAEDRMQTSALEQE